jgi:hypothetical protein
LKGAAQPMVEGVRIEAIYDEIEKEKGYVKILVPVSLKTPHRSMASREYLKRNQTGKYKLEHFDLEDMFGRRQKPLLQILLRLKGSVNIKNLNIEEDGYTEPVIYEVFVENIGRALAEKSLVYEAQLEDLGKELEQLTENLSTETDLNIPYRTALDKAVGLLKSPYIIWQNLSVEEQHRFFYFIFEEKLAYNQKTGYRTEKSSNAVRLFENFVAENNQDVEHCRGR